MFDGQRRANDPEPGVRARSLRQACVEAGLDRGGQRCADCPLKALCQSELRWLVKTAREQTYGC
jgi:hypothetical protein